MTLYKHIGECGNHRVCASTRLDMYFAASAGVHVCGTHAAYFSLRGRCGETEESRERHGEATEMREGGGEEELLCGWVERRRSRGSGLEEDNAVFSLKKELNLS